MGSIVGLLRSFISAGEEVSSEDSSWRPIQQEFFDGFDEYDYYYGKDGKGKGNPKGQGKGKQPLCEGTWCSGAGIQYDGGVWFCAICMR